MNLRTSIHSLFLFVAFALLVGSCKKRDVFGDVTLNTDRVITEFTEGKTGGSIAMDYTTDEVEVDLTEIRLFIRSIVDANGEVKVKFLPDPVAVTDFNTANGTNYTALPTALYTLMSNEATFTQVDRTAKVKVKLRPSVLLGQSYAIGLSISEVTGGEASELAGKVVVAVSVKNSYDGVYRLDFCFYHPTASPGYDCEVLEVELHTVNATTCKLYSQDFGAYVGPILNGGSITAFASQEPAFTVNPTTNKVTVTNSFPGATTFYTTITAASGYDTRYDPVQKKFYIRYGYNYDPGPVFNSANTREWTETATYLRPR
jgi:hypothetical protein